ncbi:MAG: hypothetical protein NC548_55510, partial [Lachnospiraceae bacterium]|nr:hypothetical protein [Lachnospiraceae bacterium]
RIRQTNIKNHANKIQDEESRREYLEFRKDPKVYLESYIQSNPNVTPSGLSTRLGFEDTTIILALLHEFGFDDLASNLSSMESEVVEFLRLIDPNIRISIHDRKVIAPKEIDLYLPEYHIGIECNPTTTHNCTVSLGQLLGNTESKPISYTYHRDKSRDCEDQGIFLFHIFGYEWKSRPEIIKSMLRNLINKSSTRYYARKLYLRYVPVKESRDFLDNNHRQGSCTSSVNLGLYQGDTLLSLMTFGPTRTSLGRHKSDDCTVWELLRFCNRLNTSVVGGASKLFKYFISHHDVSKVVSFSDISHTRGNLYSLLGFTKANVSDPGYGWVHLISDMYLNRVNCQKQNLPKLFDEPNLDIANKTEQQIMVEHGFVQVFDSGVIRWEYTK